MKSILSVVVVAAFLAACSVNGTGPETAWGKQGVSMLDYRTDSSMCAVHGVTYNNKDNAANSAGGINGQNATAPQQQASGTANAGSAQSSSGGASASAGLPTQTGSTYRDSASDDFVNRAAMQQRTQEMAAQRARSDALKSCLVERGYTEFELTAEQRAHLKTLAPGSDERRDYLYKLGTDPAVLAKQAVNK